jgi:putative ABC transport system permease protein
MGDYPDLIRVEPKDIDGRFINELDMRDKRKVAVIGTTIVDELFERGADPLGDEIRINGVFFQIIGVFSVRQSGDHGERLNKTIHIPFATFQQTFNVGDTVGWFAIEAKEGVSAAVMEKRIHEVLKERHKVNPKDTQAIGSRNASEEVEKLNALFSGIAAFVWFVGVFTLLAGVIGVTNIMLIVVKERTKEIGIRKALGARPWAIVSLIIQESVVLTAIAGYAGLVAGVGLLELIGFLVGDGVGGGGSRRRPGASFANPEISLEAALIATAVILIAGALAGLIPARRAARIQPVEALRAE